MPKIVDREEMQQAILAAAQRVYLSKGFHSATIADVAEEAAIGKGTIYLYYKNKDSLALAMMHNHFGGMQDRFFGGPPPETLDQFGKALKKTMTVPDDGARYIRLFFEVFGPKLSSDEFAAEFGDFFEKLGAHYAGWLSHLKDKGAIRQDVVPKQMGRTLAAMVDGVILHRGLFSIPDSRHAKWRAEMIDVLLIGLKA